MSWKERAKKVKEQEDDYSISSTEAPPVSSGWRERAKPIHDQPEYPVLDATQEGIKMLGGAIDTVDSYTGAPIRAGLGALQKGESPLSAAYEQFGEPTSKAPTMAKLAGNMGVSEEEYDTPIILNPFTREKLKVSPAGVVGGVAGMAMDPTTYIGPGIAKGIKSAGEFAAGRLGPSLARFAEERAAKAGIGHSKKYFKKIAKGDGAAARDAQKQLENIQTHGRALLSEDDAGGPAVGWFSKIEDVGENVKKKRDFYGKRIGSLGEVVDKYVPGTAPQILAEDAMNYRRTIPSVSGGDSVRELVKKEADTLSGYMPPAKERITPDGEAFYDGYPEGSFGPPAPLRFGEMQDLKNSYRYQPDLRDSIESRKDVVNKLKSNVGRRMDQSVKQAEGLATNPAEKAQLGSYGSDKKQYGIFDQISQASADRVSSDNANRIVSPSSYGTGIGAGITTGIGAAAASGNVSSVIAGLPVALLVGAGHKFALERGPAFTARLANSVSKRLLNGPRTYQKWMRPFQAAAKIGTPAVVGLHQQLMNNDPEYREMMAPVSEEP